MIRFEVRVNGEFQDTADAATAVTMVADWAAGRTGDRVSLHVGDTQGFWTSGERAVQWITGRLRAGDEVVIRIVEATLEAPGRGLPEACSFCGTPYGEVQSLVAGPGVAICETCITAFQAVIRERAPLPLGASIDERAERSCSFCARAPKDIPALLVRNDAGICPECLRTCGDIRAR